MSANELYRAFGCSHYSPVDCHQKDGVFVLEMECPREKDCCSGCGSRDVIRRGSRQPQVVAPPLALQTTTLLKTYPVWSVATAVGFFRQRRRMWFLAAITSVIDWATGAIVFVGEGKGEKPLKSFWKRLQGSGAKIVAVATDMSSACFAAVQTMANTLQGHRTGILNWYDYPISSGPMEGVNNKIGALRRAADGYRDHQYLILKLFALHEAKFKFLVERLVIHCAPYLT